MATELVLFVLIIATFQVKGDNSPPMRCADVNNILSYTFTDQMMEGHVVYQFSDGIHQLRTCPYMRIENNTVLLATNLTTVCENSFDCTFTCEDATNVELIIFGVIERLHTYTVTFYEDTYYVSVQELVPLRTRLSIHPPIAVLIEECEDNASSLHTNMAFALLQNGNGTFDWSTETSNNALYVIKDIDYERKTFYNLELLYRSVDLRGNATAAIHVTVIDVDDEDPIFNRSMYTLRPREEDTAIINTWMETSPRILAYDQDYGINASIVYSILNQSESGLFHVNSTTGLMSISRKLDREETASYVIVIQASQTDNALRTATATVFVHVDDIDDNAPTFLQDYSVSVTEHAVVGTIVAIVTAVDRDEGINSNFTYILYDDSLPVSVGPVSGIIRVTNPDRLSTELFTGGTFSFKVGTKPVQPHGLTGNNTTVTVHITRTNGGGSKATDGGAFGGAEIGLVVLSAVVVIGAIVAGIVFRKRCRRTTKIQDKGPSLSVGNRHNEVSPKHHDTAIDDTGSPSYDRTEMAVFKQRRDNGNDMDRNIPSSQRSRNIKTTSKDEQMKNILGLQKDRSLRNGKARPTTQENTSVSMEKQNRTGAQNMHIDETLTDGGNVGISGAGFGPTNIESKEDNDTDIDSLSSHDNGEVPNHDTISVLDEPDIDYTVKSVRISNEVLDLERNKILRINASMDGSSHDNIEQFEGRDTLKHSYEHHGHPSTNSVRDHKTPNNGTPTHENTVSHTEHNTEIHQEQRTENHTDSIKNVCERQLNVSQVPEETETSETHSVAEIQIGNQERYYKAPEVEMKVNQAVHNDEVAADTEIDTYKIHESDLYLEEAVDSDTSYEMIQYLPSEEDICLPIDFIDDTYSDGQGENLDVQYRTRMIQPLKFSDV